HPIPRGAASADRIRNDVAGAALRTLGDRSFAHDHRLTAAAVRQPPTIAREEHMTLTITVILALVALVCGILMLVSGRWSRYPLSAAREACRGLSDGVLASLREGATPMVLGGECTIAAGALSGALTAEPELSLLYFDAHGDFNTLATTPSHYISGMVLAHLCGRSVAPLLFPCARKISDDRVALVGARSLDSGEISNLDRSRVLRIAFDRQHPEGPGLIASS